MQIARFHSNGSLDTSFGDNEIADVNFYPLVNLREQVRNMVVQPDNKIVLAGYVGGRDGSWYGDKQKSNGGIARLNADGSVDTSFGDKGYVIDDFYTDDPALYFGETIYGVGLLSDGRIIAAGAHEDLVNSIETTLFSVHNPDGSLDQWMEGPRGYVNNLKEDSQERTISFGWTDAPDGQDFPLMRLIGDMTLRLPYRLLATRKSRVQQHLPDFDLPRFMRSAAAKGQRDGSRKPQLHP